MPKLLLKFQAAVLKEIPIEKTPLTIGRKPDNDIVIDNQSVSGHHARLTMQGSAYVIEDLQSTNGTFLNTKKILTSGLKHNDTILIGQHSLVFVDPQAQPQPAPAQTSAKPADSDATVVIAPPRQAMAGGPASEVMGTLRVIEGKLDQQEYTLASLLTYIGKSETAAIRIKGLFAPDIAALISRRPTGYLITAVKDGYPKVNNKSLSGQIDLQDNDLIEVGGIKFIFQVKKA